MHVTLLYSHRRTIFAFLEDYNAIFILFFTHYDRHSLEKPTETELYRTITVNSSYSLLFDPARNIPMSIENVFFLFQILL